MQQAQTLLVRVHATGNVVEMPYRRAVTQISLGRAVVVNPAPEPARTPARKRPPRKPKTDARVASDTAGDAPPPTTTTTADSGGEKTGE